jgi:hypothetical protein
MKREDLATKSFGQGSPFEAEYGYYLDPISPRVASTPEVVIRPCRREWRQSSRCLVDGVRR